MTEHRKSQLVGDVGKWKDTQLFLKGTLRPVISHISLGMVFPSLARQRCIDVLWIVKKISGHYFWCATAILNNIQIMIPMFYTNLLENQ